MVKRVLGFGVWVVVGLAPFLGALRVPLLTSLLELFPYSLRLPLLSFSGLLMGSIALATENAGAGHPSRKTLDRWFRKGLITLSIGFVLLLVLYPFLVVRVPYQASPPPAPPESRAFVTGRVTVPPQPSQSDCKCREGQPAESCIEDISFDEIHVRACFGALQVTLSNLILTVLYLLVTGSFAATVGVFSLREKVEASKKKQLDAGRPEKSLGN